jgi:SAM-dependent methyltransferase
VDPSVRSLLYDQPALYDAVFPDAAETELTMCLTAFTRFGAAPPRSLLDLGCGTAMNLERLARTVPDCWGVDIQEVSIAYARSVRPRLTLRVGDMRTVRLGRTFDAVTCFGNALSYALTDADLAAVAGTFAAHAHAGALLLADVLNARSYLGGAFQDRVESAVDVPGFAATSVSTMALDRERRILTRRRVWHVAGRPDVEDYAQYRLLSPDELRALVTAAGFEVQALHDNREFRDSDLTGPAAPVADVAGMRGRKLYLVARRAP